MFSIAKLHFGSASFPYKKSSEQSLLYAENVKEIPIFLTDRLPNTVVKKNLLF